MGLPGTTLVNLIRLACPDTFHKVDALFKTPIRYGTDDLHRLNDVQMIDDFSQL
jgi:hypothetical protein